MRFTYRNMFNQGTSNQNSHFMMGDASCFRMEHRNSTQQSNKLNDTLVTEINKKQNKRVLFYETIR